jgi:hypothetical protein
LASNVAIMTLLIIVAVLIGICVCCAFCFDLCLMNRDVLTPVLYREAIILVVVVALAILGVLLFAWIYLNA